MQESIESIDLVSRAVDRIKRRGRFAEFTLSNGIVLTIKSVPPILVQAILKEFEPPPPPKVYMEEKGRDEENPNDPNYLRELAALEERQSTAINNLYLGVGTTFKSVPEGYFSPEEDGWIEKVEFAANLTGSHVNIDKQPGVKRYLCWLNYYAMETATDMLLCQGLPLQLAGIREGEVEEVVESFRGVQERGADTDGGSETGSENGHSANRAARRSRSRN